MKSRNKQSYIVSPFLREVPEQYAADLAPVLKRHYPKWAYSYGFPNTKVLLNYLTQQIVLLNEIAYKVLVEVKARDMSSNVLATLKENELVIDPQTLRYLHRYEMLEIEIIKHCNYRCVYCPVRFDPKPEGVMPLDTYTSVVGRAAEYGISLLSLNHYSEPTLDRMLVQRIAIAAQYGCKVELYTNASHLSVSVSSEIAKIGNTRLVVNIPDGDPKKYASVTGRDNFSAVLENLKYASSSGIPVDIVVNAKRGDGTLTAERVADAFCEVSQNVSLWCTDNRAGMLEPSEFIAETCEHKGMLNGCFLATVNINVDSQGNVFMCAQDYDQNYKIGNLIKDTLASIVEGDQCWLFRQYLYGLLDPPKDFICKRCAWTSPKNESINLRMGNTMKLPASKEVLFEYLNAGWDVNFIRSTK